MSPTPSSKNQHRHKTPLQTLTAANQTLHDLLWRCAYDMEDVNDASMRMESALAAVKVMVGHIHVNDGEGE